VRGRERERCEIIVVLFQARVISQGEEEDITIMRNKAFIWIFFIYFGILSFLHFFLTNNFYMVKFVPHFILTFSL
jgi:hypothetical protein